MPVVHIEHEEAASEVLARYISIFGPYCRKCRTQWELELLHIRPVTPIEEATLDEVMVVCSFCKDEINQRLKLKLPEDLGPFGRSRKAGAAHNAPPHRYPLGHVARQSMPRPGFLDWEGKLVPAKKAAKKEKRPRKQSALDKKARKL